MKRVMTYILLLALFSSLLPINGYAANYEERIVTVFEDGSYLTATVIEMQSRASGTKTGSKVSNYYAEDGTLLWRATLTGTFTYTGSGSTCTSSSCSVNIYNSAWYTISKSATKSGNTAYASVTMGKKLLGLTVSQIPASISLKCDANGNLS